MDLLRDLNIRHQLQAPLADLTWYGLGGPAKVLARPSSVQQLSQLAARAHDRGASVYVLGAGANVLVSDEGVDGLVVRLDDPAFCQLRRDDRVLRVGAGFDLMKLVLESARHGLTGIECMAGIPGTIGGAVRMNAGGAFGEIGPSVKRLTVMDARGQVYAQDRDDLVFGYRSSNIVARYIVEVELELTDEDPETIVSQVKEIFVYKKNTQPLSDHSAGCAFKNPPPEAGGSAGQLIERAGLKGFCIGPARVSDHHANFIIADPGCTSRHVMALMEHIQQQVRSHFAVDLEREVIIWPLSSSE